MTYPPWRLQSPGRRVSIVALLVSLLCHAWLVWQWWHVPGSGAAALRRDALQGAGQFHRVTVTLLALPDRSIVAPESRAIVVQEVAATPQRNETSQTMPAAISGPDAGVWRFSGQNTMSAAAYQAQHVMNMMNQLREQAMRQPCHTQTDEIDAERCRSADAAGH